MQVVAAIVVAAVVFIAANRYFSRFGLLWWVAHSSPRATVPDAMPEGGCVGLSS